MVLTRQWLLCFSIVDINPLSKHNRTVNVTVEGNHTTDVTSQRYCSTTKGIYNYMNCKRKLLHCNTSINFNKTCLRKRLVPKYPYMKIPVNNKAAKRTQTQA
jgi:hypothetical protein